MLKNEFRSEGPSDLKEKVAYSPSQKVESPTTLPTLPDDLVPLPRSMHGMRRWRSPSWGHDLLRYLACRDAKLGSLGQVWGEVGRSPGKRRSSKVIRAL